MNQNVIPFLVDVFSCFIQIMLKSFRIFVEIGYQNPLYLNLHKFICIEREFLVDADISSLRVAEV